MRLLALFLASALTLIAALHFYWAAGGHSASAAVVPEMNGRPTIQPGSSALDHDLEILARNDERALAAVESGRQIRDVVRAAR